jgi:hypothetical protein
MHRLLTFRGISAVAVALAVPLAIYLINGIVEPWAFLLGAVIGVAWYILPFFPAL